MTSAGALNFQGPIGAGTAKAAGAHVANAQHCLTHWAELATMYVKRYMYLGRTEGPALCIIRGYATTKAESSVRLPLLK